MRRQQHPLYALFVILFCLASSSVAQQDVEESSPIECSVTGSGPIANAEVSIIFSVPSGDAEHEPLVIEETVYTTNEQGKYSIVPPDLALAEVTVSTRIAHPQYLTRQLKPISLRDLARLDRSTHRRTRLKQAYPLKGTVLLPDGKPAANAHVRVASKYRAYSWKFFDPNEYHWTTTVSTDAEGKFAVQADANCTVQVDLTGHATQLLDSLDVTNATDVTLRLPVARTLAGSVVDGDGKPIAYAVVSAQRSFEFSEFNMPLGFGLTTVAGADGHYEFPPLRDDIYKVTVSGRLGDANAAEAYRRQMEQRSTLQIAGLSRGNEHAAAQPTRVSPIPVDQIFLSQEVTVTNAVHQLDFAPQENHTIELQYRFPDGRLEGQKYGVSITGNYRNQQWNGRYEYVGDDGRVELLVPQGTSNVKLGIGPGRFRLPQEKTREFGDTIHLGRVTESIRGITVFKPAMGKLEAVVQWPEGYLKGRHASLVARYVRKGFRSNSAVRQSLLLSGSRQTNATHYEATGIAGEPIRFVISLPGTRPTILHERVLTLEPDEVRTLKIDLSDL